MCFDEVLQYIFSCISLFIPKLTEREGSILVENKATNMFVFTKYLGPLLLTWISNYTHYNVWDEITYPFLNFNGASVEV